MKVVYQWNYDPEVEELRSLYVKAAEAQWVAERDIDWDRPIDLEKFATTPLGGRVADRADVVLEVAPTRRRSWELDPPHGRLPLSATSCTASRARSWSPRSS